jgi:hypothetical protein
VGRTRPGLVALLLALLALTGLAGCDAGRPPAAKVGETEISSATLIEDLEAEAARAEATGASSTPALAVEGTFSAAATAELLGRRIRYELLGEVLEARGVTITQQERDLAEQTLCAGGDTQVPEGECPGLEGYPASYREFQIELTARGNAYSTAISDEGGNEEELRATYEDLAENDPDQLAVRCYTGATITDEASVQQIQVRVAAGASFADAITAVEGAEPTTQDACSSVAGLPEEVVNAEEGTVLGPYPNSQGGMFIVQMGEARTGTFEEVSAALQQQAATENEEAAVEELLTKAEVMVNPKYGRWDRSQGTVVPPAAPRPAAPEPAPASS